MSCDASGLKRYFTVFQDKFNFIEEGDVYEFRFVKVGINGLSLSVGWGSFCEKVENPAIQTIFENFFAYDQVILGQIDGVNEFSKFMGCDNCGGGVKEHDAVCKICKKMAPTASENFR